MEKKYLYQITFGREIHMSLGQLCAKLLIEANANSNNLDINDIFIEANYLDYEGWSLYFYYEKEK